MERAGDHAGGATHAGGQGPEATSQSSSFKAGKPHQSSTNIGPYSVECAYCDGEVPKCIAKQRQDCGAYFHLAHYHAHRHECQCPAKVDNWCLWCNRRINEEQNKVKCSSCHCDLHEHCHAAHLPCLKGWFARQSQTAEEGQPQRAETLPGVRSMVARTEAFEGAIAQPALQQPDVGNDLNRPIQKPFRDRSEFMQHSSLTLCQPAQSPARLHSNSVRFNF